MDIYKKYYYLQPFDSLLDLVPSCTDVAVLDIYMSFMYYRPNKTTTTTMYPGQVP